MEDRYAIPNKWYTQYIADKNAFWRAYENSMRQSLFDTAKIWARMANICGLGASTMMEITAKRLREVQR